MPYIKTIRGARALSLSASIKSRRRPRNYRLLRSCEKICVFATSGGNAFARDYRPKCDFLPVIFSKYEGKKH